MKWLIASTAALTATLTLSVANIAQALTFTGSTAGSWGLPVSPSGSTLLSSQNGGTNNRLEWGRVDQCWGCTTFNNYVQYDGTSFSADVNQTFSLGNLKYQNGSVWDAFNGDFPLNIALSLTNPVSSSQVFNYSFNILTTPNVTGDAVLDGDKLEFQSSGLSSQTFKIDNIDYTLQLIGFSSDGGNTLVDIFNSPEGSLATAQLYGKLTAVIPPIPDPTPDPHSVPEPGTMIGLGAFGLFLANRARQKN